MTKLDLKKEFEGMNAYPLFEIEHKGEYHVFDINCTEQGLEAGSICNIGFLHVDKENLTVPWDECFSLDGHLEELYEACVDYLYNNN